MIWRYPSKLDNKYISMLCTVFNFEFSLEALFFFMGTYITYEYTTKSNAITNIEISNMFTSPMNCIHLLANGAMTIHEHMPIEIAIPVLI